MPRHAPRHAARAPLSPKLAAAPAATEQREAAASASAASHSPPLPALVRSPQALAPPRALGAALCRQTPPLCRKARPGFSPGATRAPSPEKRARSAAEERAPPRALPATEQPAPQPSEPSAAATATTAGAAPRPEQPATEQAPSQPPAVATASVGGAGAATAHPASESDQRCCYCLCYRARHSVAASC